MSRHPVSARKATFIDRLTDALLERFDPPSRWTQSQAMLLVREALVIHSLDTPTYLRRGIHIPGLG